jgi:tetratricopeptide (TPR) repeat protein
VAVIAESGWSQAQVAAAFVRVAAENGAREFASVGRSHVSHWVAGSRPSGAAPAILCEALSRRVGRVVTPADIGLVERGTPAAWRVDWDGDILAQLVEFGRADVDAGRRHLLAAATFSLGSLALPDASWWDRLIDQGRRRALSSSPGSVQVGHGELEAAREMASFFSRVDQRRGGGHARTVVVQYLLTDVTRYLRGRYGDDQVRREMFAVAGKLACQTGWMAFDEADHATAQRWFVTAVKLAAEADDAPLAGYILRAMAHQAVDLGHVRQALDLSSASLEGRRYRGAGPRERGLLGTVRARALAAAGDSSATVRTITQAETDLAAATADGDNSTLLSTFGKGELAHQTACALRDLGDLSGAAREFSRSVRTRNAAVATRAYALTLGELGAVQARQGHLEQACSTWASALEAMDGVRSGRTRRVAVEMRTVLSPFRSRKIPGAAEVHSRAGAYLNAV